MAHKAGFVSIIGKPNVGKSTLMNRILGQHLSIVSAKAQTTRHRIKGILNAEDYQIVFSDTPGLLDPHYLLHQKMMDFVDAALEDADAVLFITDLAEQYMDEALVARLKKIRVPLVVVINKVDQSGIDEINKLVHGWKKHLQPHAVIPASAINDFNTTVVRDTLLEVLPESPAFFPKDDVSDASLRFFTAEFIREKIFMHYRDEIPYASTVDIEAFKEGEQQVHISAVIYVERDSQKGILIGKKGSSIKRVGTEARHDIESFLGKKVFLELFVKVEKDWRKHENKLRRFGYSS
ncbi:MAG: GTPase Era [Bacteroidia bacterium]|jgi:GTP-binding protein Era|nr:GTPase Era [Bacteroidia bacterium]MBP7437323.1 GTPase Era [Bacteroidia bacterium]MBP7772578.1 GTPase Era [Bacteroidia bacterium]